MATAWEGGQPRVWPQRVLKGFIALLVVCLLVAGGGYAYLRYQLGRIDRLAIPGLDDAGSNQVMNVLLVGSDSRDRVTGELAEATGANEVTGKRSDTMMVLHIDSREKKAAIFSVPRDLWVPIAGAGYSERVNTAFSVGGASGLVATIEAALGIPINHYVEVDFVGFKDIVDAVGGVNIYVPAPVRDEVTGLYIEDPGCVRLDGTGGLAFVRSREYETFESGYWDVDPTGDLGRIQRQQDFIRRMLRKAVSAGISNPLTLNRLIGIGVRDVTLDRGMTTTDIVRLARRFKSLDPETVDMVTFPTRDAVIGGAQVLLLQEKEAQPYIDRLNGIRPPEPAAPGSVQPADVRVRVLNGFGGGGAASDAGFELQGVGFNVADWGDADAYDYDRTVLRHATGQRAKAELVNKSLVTSGTLQEDSSLRTVDVALVLGADYQGVRARPAGGAGAATSAPTTAAKQSPAPAPAGAAAGPSC